MMKQQICYFIVLIILQIIYIQKVFGQQNTNNSQFYDKVHSFRIQGNITHSYYYTDIYVGTPPQKQSVIIDTGSHILAFPCSDCKEYECGNHSNDPFQIYQTSTIDDIACGEKIGNYECHQCDNDKNKCLWGIHYAEGSSIKGYTMKDYIVMGQVMDNFLENDYKNVDIDFVKYLNRERVMVPFGCTTKETNLFLSQKADGILGLSMNSNSNMQWPNIIDQYYQKHMNNTLNNTEKVFSLCYGKNGGYMSIGGYNQRLQKLNAKTGILNIKSQNMYSIFVKSIKINNNVILVNKDSMIESGTTVLFLPKVMFQGLVSNITSHCQNNKKCGDYFSKSYLKCWQKPDNVDLQQFYQQFPDVEFDLINYTYKWEPRYYLYEDEYTGVGKGIYCYAFEESYDLRILLSASWMQGHDILFDRERKEIRITESDCDPEMINPENIKNYYKNDEKANQEDKELLKQFQGEKLLDNHKNFDWFDLPIGGTVKDWFNYFQNFGYQIEEEMKNYKFSRNKFTDQYSDEYSEFEDYDFENN